MVDKTDLRKLISKQYEFHQRFHQSHSSFHQRFVDNLYFWNDHFTLDKPSQLIQKRGFLYLRPTINFWNVPYSTRKAILNYFFAYIVKFESYVIEDSAIGIKQFSFNGNGIYIIDLDKLLVNFSVHEEILKVPTRFCWHDPSFIQNIDRNNIAAIVLIKFFAWPSPCVLKFQTANFSSSTECEKNR